MGEALPGFRKVIPLYFTYGVATNARRIFQQISCPLQNRLRGNSEIFPYLDNFEYLPKFLQLLKNALNAANLCVTGLMSADLLDTMKCNGDTEKE
jgi:hypothetical protein